jgi:hypothetical protein
MMDEGKDCAQGLIEPAVVCVMRGHKGKILTTEITEDAEGEETN